jgi:hypothetical protein
MAGNSQFVANELVSDNFLSLRSAKSRHSDRSFTMAVPQLAMTMVNAQDSSTLVGADNNTLPPTTMALVAVVTTEAGAETTAQSVPQQGCSNMPKMIGHAMVPILNGELGSPSLTSFFSSLELFQMVNSYTNMQMAKQLPTFLRKTPLMAYSRAPNDVKMDYNRLKEYLKEKLQSSFTSQFAGMDLLSKKQSSQQSIGNYGYDLENLFDVAFPNMDATSKNILLKQILISGLENHDIKSKTLQSCTGLNFADTVSLARTLQAQQTLLNQPVVQTNIAANYVDDAVGAILHAGYGNVREASQTKSIYQLLENISEAQSIQTRNDALVVEALKELLEEVRLGNNMNQCVTQTQNHGGYMNESGHEDDGRDTFDETTPGYGRPTNEDWSYQEETQNYRHPQSDFAEAGSQNCALPVIGSKTHANRNNYAPPASVMYQCWYCNGPNHTTAQCYLRLQDIEGGYETRDDIDRPVYFIANGNSVMSDSLDSNRCPELTSSDPDYLGSEKTSNQCNHNTPASGYSKPVGVDDLFCYGVESNADLDDSIMPMNNEKKQFLADDDMCSWPNEIGIGPRGTCIEPCDTANGTNRSATALSTSHTEKFEDMTKEKSSASPNHKSDGFVYSGRIFALTVHRDAHSPVQLVKQETSIIQQAFQEFLSLTDSATADKASALSSSASKLSK